MSTRTEIYSYVQWAEVADGVFPPLGVTDGVQHSLGVYCGAGENLDGAGGRPLEKSRGLRAP